MDPFALGGMAAAAAEDDPAAWFRAQQARKTVDEAVSAARLLGGVFVTLGVLALLPLVSARVRGGMQFLAVANAVILIGPGVWYFFAATLVSKLDRRAATAALRVAAAQGAAVALGLLAAAVARRRELSQIAAPAMLAVFFMPALGALAYHLRRAREAMNALGGGEIGFQPLAPVPVIPVAPEGRGDPPPPHAGAEQRD